MLQWAVIFLVVALVAAIFGFGGIAVVSVELARIVFGIFVVLFIITAIMHLFRGKTPPM